MRHWAWRSVLLTGALAAPAAMADTDVSASTPLDSASSAQLNNIQLAVDALDGAYVGYGDVFSFNDVVGDRTSQRGYKTAVNGRGVKAMGGGVAQVATTLYLALKQLWGIDYVEKKVYGSRFAQDYVSSGSNAIITDSSEGIDFAFENNYEDFYINIWTTDYSVECTLSSYDDDDWRLRRLLDDLPGRHERADPLRDASPRPLHTSLDCATPPGNAWSPAHRGRRYRMPQRPRGRGSGAAGPGHACGSRQGHDSAAQ